MMAPTQVILLVVSLFSLDHCFTISFSSKNSVSHVGITQMAILRKTAEVCRDVAADEGRDFTLNIDDSLTATKVEMACSTTTSSTSPVSSVPFITVIQSIRIRNILVDSFFASSAPRHFDDETFRAGRDIITAGVSSIKANVRMENFETGRETLGQICHTLQDFYSHSNWVEMGETTPYNALISPDQPLENLAPLNVATCRSCPEDNTKCEDNLLPQILSQKLLTSGYFSLFSSEKPAGKCSHGGRFDKTSTLEPVGGINKDELSSNHGSLHIEAARLAVDATLELLEDIRLAVGDKTFLRFMGLSQSSALCFVIDTTGSMADDIAAAKSISFSIIDARRGTPQEPSLYILVPFNDPSVGPVTRTTDADTFKNEINRLTASGGGDNPELSLAGLQLALTSAPPSSDLFVFTDAPAKDADLRGTVTALIESTKSVVTFLLTDVLARRRRRRQIDGQVSTSRVLRPGQTQLYRDLARSSGGQTVEVSKLDLSEATAVIEDLSANAVVTIFQVAVNPGQPGNFAFGVDALLSNIIIYITGVPTLTFRLTDPTGGSQMSNQSSGPLASITSVGNLRRISLNSSSEPGQWQLSVNSDRAYTVKVTGQSSVNFVFNRVEEQEGVQGGLFPQDGRPIAGGNVTLQVTVTGSDTANVTNVTLFDSSGPTEIIGSLQSGVSNIFLVTFTQVPAGEYAVRLTGEDSSAATRTTANRFQRQASTQITTSSLSVTAQADSSNIEPGSNISVPFTVSSSATGTFTVRVNNDRRYTSTSPATVTIGAGDGGRTNGTVTLTTPANVASGTDVTLTIEAENAAATDINFAVLRFSVVAVATDVSGPVCQVVSVSGICPSSPSLCASSRWEFIANLTDGINGTGIASITLRRGNGTLNTSAEVAAGAGGENVTVVNYNASCCFQIVELVAVDGVGNVGLCEGQARSTPATTRPATNAPAATVPATTAPATNAPTTSNASVVTLSMPHCLWIMTVVSLLWK